MQFFNKTQYTQNLLIQKFIDKLEKNLRKSVFFIKNIHTFHFNNFEIIEINLDLR